MRPTHLRQKGALVALSSLVLLGVSGTALGQDGERGGTETIVVTATRREELVSRVPVSVAAYSQERLDRQGVRSIDDVSRLTPGITFARADGRNANASSIAIRGISSTVAASTTGIYIDDTPIQTRIIGAGASNFNTYPSIFDLERVEVLRGPQGTLWGAGSEGGTLRFIAPKPDVSEYSVYARGEAGFIDNGGPNYEAGVAVGGPIVHDKLAFRISGFARRDGGYVDRVNTDPKPTDPDIGFGPGILLSFDADASTPPTSLPFRNRTAFVQEKNSNYQDTRVVKGALSLQPTDALEIAASVYYQKIYANDGNVYWLSLSDPDKGRFEQGNPLGQPSTDRFWLPSLSVHLDAGPVRLVSVSSYFDRHQTALNDYTTFESALWAGFWEFPVGMFAPTTQINDQTGWTQEVRLESTETDARLKWVAGFFWQKNRQVSRQFVEDTFLPNLFADVVGVPFAVAFGQGLVDGLYTFNQDPVIAYDQQYAGFANIDLKVVEKLTLSAGVRLAKTNFSATADYNGPVVGPPVHDSGSQKETPVTPRFSISYQANDNNLFYASAAKGFRIGGYNPQVGLPCSTGLGPLPPALPPLGYFPSPGNPTGRPALFDSDSLWSYEIGSKNALFGNRVRMAVSAYYIDWKNIQQGVALACGFAFTINQGRAVSEGFDLDATFRVTDELTLGLAVGYNDSKLKEDVFGGPLATTSIAREGNHLPGSPWTLTANGQYDFSVFETDAYVRFDYEFHSRGPNDTAALDERNNAFFPAFPIDPLATFRTPETHLLSMRAGVKIGGADISAFVRNLTNEHPSLGGGLAGDLKNRFNPVDQHAYTRQTITPRIVGATISYRY